MSTIAISGRWVNYDELLSATLLELNVLLPEVIEEFHDTGHRLCEDAFLPRQSTPA